ncbi:MAG: hypothetical protein J2P27_05180 [Actinobacteria bacterium]|nr:hypothetical protein [Actinomycetota bacterium]
MTPRSRSYRAAHKAARSTRPSTASRRTGRLSGVTFAVTAVLAAVAAAAAGVAAGLVSSAGGPVTQVQDESGAGRTAVAHPKPTPVVTHTRAAAAPQRPFDIYDSVIPAAIPRNVLAATYSTGHFAVSAAQMASRPTLWIDAWGTDPVHTSVLDVEPGDATPAIAVTWVTRRLMANHDPRTKARIYTTLKEWPTVRAAIATLPAWMQSHVRWWVADPTGVRHMVRGAHATQWYWGPSYDISTASPGF